MTAPTVLQIQQGLQARLDTIPSLTGRTYEHWPQTIAPPCGWIWLPEIPAYHYAMGRGTMDYRFPVYVAVGSQVDSVSQAALAAYIAPTGTESVLDALEGDQTLGGLSIAQNGVTVLDFRPTTLEEANTINAVGGVWMVQVLAPGV